MSRIQRPSVAGLCLLSAVACAGDAPKPAVTTTDSAGVAIVVSSAEAGGREIDVTGVPAVRLGEAGSTEFFRVAGAIRLSDGSFVVLDGGSREVRFFDSAGALVASEGGEGEGPGEFDRFASVSPFHDDSVLVFDNWLRRATIYDRDAVFGRVLSLVGDAQVQDLRPLGDDGLIALTWSLEAFADVEGPWRLPYTILELGLSGEVEDSLGSIQGPGGYKVVSADGGYSDFAPLIIQDGHLSARNDEAVLGSADRWEIRRVSADGQVRQIMRVPALDRALTAEDVDRERSAMLAQSSRPEYQAIVRKMEPPSQWPAYEDLLLAPNGWIWAAKYRSPRTQQDEPTEWIVFDEKGAWIATGSTPARFEVLDVGEGYLLGVRRDELDVEHVELLEWTFLNRKQHG